MLITYVPSGNLFLGCSIVLKLYALVCQWLGIEDVGLKYCSSVG